MTWPVPQPGLVIRYSYLWEREARQGREEGVKDRPCAVVLAPLSDNGGAPLVRKRYEETLALGGSAVSYEPLPNRVGIQNWRGASTTGGMSRLASWAKDGLARPFRGAPRTGRPAVSTQCDRIGSSSLCSIEFGLINRDQVSNRSFMTAQNPMHQGCGSTPPFGLCRNRGSKLLGFVESVLLITLCRMNVAAIAEKSACQARERPDFILFGLE